MARLLDEVTGPNRARGRHLALKSDLGIDSVGLVYLLSRVAEELGCAPEDGTALRTVDDLCAFEDAEAAGPSGRDQLTAQVTALVAELLGTSGPAELLPETPLRALGLDSQSVVTLIARVEQHCEVRFGLDTPPGAFASIGQLVDEVTALRSTNPTTR